MEKIIIESPDKHTTIMVASNFIARKHKLVGYDKIKKWFGFGTKGYVVIVEKIIDYPQEIKKAIQDERYEEVSQLKKEFTVTETEFYSELEKQVTNDLLKLSTLFN